MNLHTPAPWHITNERDYETSNGCVLACMSVAADPALSYRGEICNIQSADHVGGITHAEAIANGRLICAAPAMLAALRGVVLVADRQTDEFEYARIAIALATEQLA